MAEPLAPEHVAAFVEGGHAIFTVQNTKTGGRFTYKVAHPRQDSIPSHRQAARAHFVRFWVSVFAGEGTGYLYVGWIDTSLCFVHDPKRGRLHRDALAIRGFDWFWRHRTALDAFPHVSIWHEGRCGRCGRSLTDPLSIKLGIGPVCRSIGDFSCETSPPPSSSSSSPPSHVQGSCSTTGRSTAR